MNCTVHADTPATAYCRTCGKAMCANCQRTVHGVIYCEDCLATRVSGVTPVAVAAPMGGASPVLAALLAFIPGVGAIYNGQVIKGMIHVAVFAGLVWGQTLEIPDGLHVLLGLGIAFWVFYQVFDAYTTARARLYGLPIPDPLGIERAFGGGNHPTAAVGAPVPPPATYGTVPQGMPMYVPPPPQVREPSPVGAVVLIGLGVLFLLNTMGLWHFHWIGRMWPLILIALGLWLFVRRFGTGAPAPQTTTNPPEQQ